MLKLPKILKRGFIVMQSSVDINKELQVFFNNTPNTFPLAQKIQFGNFFDQKTKSAGNISANIAMTFQDLEHFADAIAWYNRSIQAGYLLSRWFLAELLTKKTPHQNINEAIRLYHESWPLWETETDRKDIIDVLKKLRTTHPSASVVLVEIYYDYYKNGDKQIKLLSEIKKQKEKALEFLMAEMTFLKQNAPELAENMSDQIKALTTLGYIAYESPVATKTQGDEKQSNDTLPVSPKPKKPLPVPRKFTWTDREISRSTGRHYVRVSNMSPKG